MIERNVWLFAINRAFMSRAVFEQQRTPIVRKDKLAILAVFLLAIAVTVGFRLLPGGVKNPDTPAVYPSLSNNTGALRGIALKLHNSDPDIPYEKYVEEIAESGANTISLVLAWHQENCSSTSIFMDSRKVPPDSRVRGLINLAHKKKLQVVLMPILLLENPREGEWRGKISPDNWDDWWEDYINCIMHYTNLAAETDVEVLMIGSELVSTEEYKDRWIGLIGRVRRHFKGLVCYSANWDHYRPVKWWDQLDMIGMTSYYELTSDEKPTVEKLVSAWKPIKQKILEWQKTIEKPIFFTEVGWPNQATCAQYPWDYYRATDRPDPQAQANCFEAFFQTWAGEKALAGYLIWEWRNYPGQSIEPDKDTSYVPYGKPAMEVIRRYFRFPVGQSTTQPAGSSAQQASHNSSS